MAVELIMLHNGNEYVIEAGSRFAVEAGDRLMLQGAESDGVIRMLVRFGGDSDSVMIDQPIHFPIDLGEAEQYIPTITITLMTMTGRFRRAYELERAVGAEDTEGYGREPNKLSEITPNPEPEPVPAPWPDPEAMETIRTLSDALERAEKERDEARECLKKAEEELEGQRRAAALPAQVAEQEALIEKWQRKLDELRNTEFRLRSLDLADAQGCLANCKAQIDQVKEALKATQAELAEQTQLLEKDQEKLAEQTQLLEAEKEKLAREERLLAEQREKTLAAEQELEALQRRHCDAKRAKEELEQKRRDLGLMDEELLRCETEKERISGALAAGKKELAEITAQAEACRVQRDRMQKDCEAAREHLEALTQERSALDQEIGELEAKIIGMESLKKERRRRWEQSVRRFSALLSTVIREKFDLDDTYNLLVNAMNSGLVENLETEAAEQREKLDECGRTLAAVSEWIGRVKSRKAL